jgi:hypothetical protein
VGVPHVIWGVIDAPTYMGFLSVFGGVGAAGVGSDGVTWEGGKVSSKGSVIAHLC